MLIVRRTPTSRRLPGALGTQPSGAPHPGLRL